MKYCNQEEWYKNLQVSNPGAVDIGDFTYGVFTIRFWGNDTRLKIGKFCQIAHNAFFFLGGEHDSERISTYPFDVLSGGNGEPDSITNGDIVVGNDVWIGKDSMILSGVKIGNGCVIGAGSVVRRIIYDVNGKRYTHIPAYSIVMGNPAKIISTRFSTDIISKLQSIAWWDFSEEEIKNAIPILRNGDVNKLIETYGAKNETRS